MSMRMSKKEQKLLVLNAILEVISDLNENDTENFLYSVNYMIEDKVISLFDAERNEYGLLDDDQMDEAETLTLQLQCLAEPLLYKAIVSQVKLVKTKTPRKKCR